MDRGAWGTADRAHGEGLGRRLRLALEALRFALLDGAHLAEIPFSATLNQWDPCGQAEAVHMPPGGKVVERVQHKIILFEVILIELWAHNAS